MYFRKAFHYYWPQIKKYKWSGMLVFLGYGLGNLLAYIVTPFLYKKIIDLVSVSSPVLVPMDQLFHLVYFVVLTIIAYLILYRVGDYSIVYFQGNVMREIHNDTFQRLMNHSYKFFSNSFAGSLVAKAKRFVASFERLSDVVSFSLWSAFLQLTGVFVVLFWTNYKLGF